MRINSIIAASLLLGASTALALADGATEFCLDGELDLGLRYQGMTHSSGELYPTTWCVISEDESSRVLYSAVGKSNPDMDGSWAVAYLPPDIVRIVNRESPPDIEFQGTDNQAEALRVRRLDPRRLLEEYRKTAKPLENIAIETCEDRVIVAKMSAELPLRGRVEVEWQWDWLHDDKPGLELKLDGQVLFKATGRWRIVPDEEATRLWTATPGAAAIKVPGDRWPAKINLQLIELADGVHMVRGVRTGFQHMVVDTSAGLVVADAPAGWVEFHHLPPSDLVPGQGVSGLSEKLVDFLKEHFPTRPIRAVALTHFHDDHAGGARAFAAAGARVYAPSESASFVETALNGPAMPRDRQVNTGSKVTVLPVSDPVVIGAKANRVKLSALGPNPHSAAMLGVWAVDRDYFFVSDVHVPRSDAEAPVSQRSATECWFAEWAVKHLPPSVLIANSHSAALTPVSRLKKYLSSDLCKAL